MVVSLGGLQQQLESRSFPFCRDLPLSVSEEFCGSQEDEQGGGEMITEERDNRDNSADALVRVSSRMSGGERFNHEQQAIPFMILPRPMSRGVRTRELFRGDGVKMQSRVLVARGCG